MTKCESKTRTEDKARRLREEAGKLRERAEAMEKEANSLEAPQKCKEAADMIAKRKGKIAVFLGAGASRTFGRPLTGELLPIILNGLMNQNLFEEVNLFEENRLREKEHLFEGRGINTEDENRVDRALLQEALIALCPGLELKSKFLEENKNKLPLVTSLLSILDYSLASSQALISGLTPERIKDATVLLERAVYEAIEHKKEDAGQIYWLPRKHNDLNKVLVAWLESLRSSESDLAFITSNYDCAVEQAWDLESRTLPEIACMSMDVGFEWTWPHGGSAEMIPRPEKPQRRLYKLHGSTNWLRCGLCDRIYINPQVAIAVFAYKRKVSDDNTCHCGHKKLEVQIVSPSFVREMLAPNLISVWQSALNWLRDADDWIVIGYSFPDEDLNIRSLFTRALASREDPPYVTAIQLGSNESTRVRYESFFPRGQLTFLTSGLEEFLKCTS